MDISFRKNKAFLSSSSLLPVSLASERTGIKGVALVLGKNAAETKWEELSWLSYFFTFILLLQTNYHSEDCSKGVKP